MRDDRDSPPFVPREAANYFRYFQLSRQCCDLIESGTLARATLLSSSFAFARLRVFLSRFCNNTPSSPLPFLPGAFFLRGITSDEYLIPHCYIQRELASQFSSQKIINPIPSTVNVYRASRSYSHSVSLFLFAKRVVSRAC